jgi:SCY1-like protein 1
VRHPNVLAFLHSTEAEVMDGGVVKPTMYLVTEPVMPLSEKIRELDLQGTQRYNNMLLHQMPTLKNALRERERAHTVAWM